MFLTIDDTNYKDCLDRFDEIWNLDKQSDEAIKELEVLADLISAFEERKFPLFNSPTYRDFFDAKFKKRIVQKL